MISMSWSPSMPVVVAQLASARKALGELSGPLEDSVTTIVGPSIDRNFAAGGIPAWRPLADETIAVKGHARILEATGRLREIATSAIPWDIRDDSAVLSAHQLGSAGYGIFHELGTRFMPTRSWGMYQESDIRDIEEVFLEHGVDAIAGNVSFIYAT